MDDKANFTPGCMYWVKLSSFPWWPCMICASPDGDGYSKALKSCNKFHVQFFGPDLERAWITESNLIPYQPKSVFQGILAKRRKDNPSQSAKYELKISNHFKKRWEEACKDADMAFVYEKAERIRRFSRFAIPKETLHEPAGSEITLNDVEGLPLTLEEELESLNLFLSREMALRLQSQPDVDKVQLDAELRHHWNNLNISSKRSFLNKQSPLVIEAMPRKSSRKSQLSRPPSPKESPKAKLKRVVKDDTPKVEIDRLTTSPGAFVVSPACDNHLHYSSDDEYEESDLIKCTGLCERYFHPGCVTGDIGSSKDLEDPSKFKCMSCRAKRVLCRVCFKPVDDEEKEKCQMQDCGKHFHYKCISSISGVIIKNDCIQRCPSHVCVSCFLEDQDVSTAPYNELIHCKRCCRAYHPNDLCVPAGSEEINLSFIMCPIHMDPGRKTIYPTGFCLICKGPKPPRFNCSTCPRTFHPACLGLENAPATYECDDCRSDNLPRYAQIVWMKSTACRWWPCELIHPRNAPMNLSQLKHAPSEFLVHYIGSTDYGWVSRSQTIPYRSGINSPLNNPIGNANVSRDKMFNRGIRLAKVFYDVYVSILLRRGLPVKSVKESPLNDEELAEQITSECAAVLGILDQSEAEAKALKQAKEKFESVSENIIASEQLKLIQQPLPDTVCDCASKDRQCTQDSECRNVLESIECNPKVCSVMAEDASFDCGNKKFTKGPAKVQSFLTTNKGVGLKVLEDVHEGSFIIEYIGEVIDAAGEANRRLSKAVIECSREGSKAISTDLLRGTYLLQFTPDLVIDAERFGNYARFINHSCEPNAKPKVVNVDGTLRLCIVALGNVKANEEVTIDYCASNLLDAYFLLPTTVCVCDKPKCSVSLGMAKQFYSSKYTSSERVAMVEDDDDDACSSVTTEAASTKEKDQELMAPPAVPSRRADSQAGSVASTTSRRSVRQSLKTDAASNENQPPPAPQAKFTFKKPDMEQKISVVKSRRTGQVKHDIECYRCQDGGELIMCGKIDCPRVYHIGCLGLAKAPTAALWFCPWHFCDICGKWASHQCYLCTNSYCKDHVMENGREMIRVRDVDRENYEYMTRLLNTPEFENSAVREELMTANAMRVLWVCHGHFVRNDGGEEDIKPERNEEQMDLDPTPSLEGVSTEVVADPVLPIPESSAPVVAESGMEESAETKMDVL